MKRTIAISLLMPWLWGCHALVIGGAGAAGVYLWSSGNLARNYMQPMDETWHAALSAVTSLKLTIISKRRDSHYGVIEVKLLNDKTLKITIEKWTHRETRVTIRVGEIGDKEVSTKVHEELERSFAIDSRFRRSENSGYQ